MNIRDEGVGGREMKPTVVTVTLNPALDKTITIPRLQVGGLNRIQDIRFDAGGKGINVAKVLRSFGIPVTVTGIIAGTDGQKVIKDLEARAIRTDFMEIRGELRTNLKVVDQESRVTTEFNESGLEVTAADLQRFEAKLLALLEDARFLVLGGSLPQGAPDDIYQTYIEIAKRMGVKTILDADGAALRKGVQAVPYVIKPNLLELEQIAGRKLPTRREIVEAGRKLIQTGISYVIISLGSEGAVILDREKVYEVTPFAITPRSTVGAGDSMVAACIYSLLQQHTTEEMARWVTTAGTISASKWGTQVCTHEEVQQHVNRVQVQERQGADV
jgi:1-phosphofructokinase